MDLTTVMPVRNAWFTMGRALRALGLAAESMPIRLLICENEGTDPSVDDCKSPWLPPMLVQLGLVDHEVLQPMPCSASSNQHQRMQENLCRMWGLFLATVDTPYMLWLDADVLIPPDGIYRLLDGMLGNNRLGAYGIDYPVAPGSDQMHDHVPNGCTLYRMEAVRQIEPIGSQGCVCRWWNEKLTAAGWEVHKVPMVTGQHIE